MPPVTGPSSCFARTSKTKMEACHWLHAYCRAPFRQGKPASRCVYSMHVYVSFEDTQHLCIYGFPKLYSSDHFFPPKKSTWQKGIPRDQLFHTSGTVYPLRDLRFYQVENNIQPNRVNAFIWKDFPKVALYVPNDDLKPTTVDGRHPKQPPEM